jgi:imidazolonepropionase-like amidohydrolase
MAILFTNLRLLDPEAGALLNDHEVLVDGDRIVEVGPNLEAPGDVERIDLGGRTLMPGMIDCHVHVVSAMVDLWANTIAPSSLTALRAARIMREILGRGFTTVRDLAGADIGLVWAVEEGLIEGPRLVICGKGLSMTGGHGDARRRTDTRPNTMEDRLGALTRIVDGVDEVRKAVREELKQGAHFIKIMANGGVSSPTDPIHSIQYSDDEILAIVEEAENAGTYVAAHVYTDESIRRVVELGIRSIEHCNLIESDTAEFAGEAGVIAVPTLVAYEGLALEGEKFGLGEAEQAKIDIVRDAGVESLRIMRDAGLPMAFGSDLLGELQKYHCMEFEIRSRVLSPAEIIRSATIVGAELCDMEGEVGVIEPGAYADLLVVDGDPLSDISLLQDDGAHMDAIMMGGEFFKRELE